MEAVCTAGSVTSAVGHVDSQGHHLLPAFPTSEKLPDSSHKQRGCAIPCESACEVPDARNHSEWSKEKNVCSEWMGGNKNWDMKDEALGVGET